MQCRTWKHKIELTLAVLLISGCGGSSNPPVIIGAGNSAVLALRLDKDAASHPLAQVQSYLVQLSGDGFEPIEATFPGDASTGTINNIPVGKDRSVIVEGLNSQGLVVRRGTLNAIEILSGEGNELEVKLETVPIFTNLHNGSIIANTRLIPEVLSTPGSVVELMAARIDSNGTSTPEVLPDISRGTTDLGTDPVSGLVQISTSRLPPGNYELTVSDVDTQESNTIKVRLLDGDRRHGAPFFSGSAVLQDGLVTRLGGPWSFTKESK